MNDLLLWRLLDSPDEQPERLAELLEEASVGSIQDRFPYLGRLSGVLESNNPELRALGVRFFGGAQGYLAYRKIVSALDDEDPEVRRSAVAALKKGTVPSTSSMYLYLAADPELGWQSLDRLSPIDLNDRHVAVILDLVEDARLDANEARRLLSAIPCTQWEELIVSLSGMETSFQHTLVRALRLFLVGEASVLDEDCREDCRVFFRHLARVALSKEDKIPGALGRIIETSVEQHGEWTVSAFELRLLINHLLPVPTKCRSKSAASHFEFSLSTPTNCQCRRPQRLIR